MQLTCSIVYLLPVTISFSAQHRAVVERYFTTNLCALTLGTRLLTMQVYLCRYKSFLEAFASIGS